MQKKTDKSLLLIAALALGGIGIHKFMEGKYRQGALYFLFCWTYIPLILSVYDAICIYNRDE